MSCNWAKSVKTNTIFDEDEETGWRSDIDEDDGNDDFEEYDYEISESWLMKMRKEILTY